MNIFNFLENTCKKYLLFSRKKRQYHYWTKYFKNCLKSLNRKTLTNKRKKSEMFSVRILIIVVMSSIILRREFSHHYI